MTFTRARSAVRPPNLDCPLDRDRYLAELFASTHTEFGALRMEFPDDDGGDGGTGGGDGGDGSDGGGDAGGDGGGTGGTGTFTQEQMNEASRRSKKDGERVARRAVYQALGLDPESTKPEDLEAVKVALQKQRDADAASLTEAQKAEKAAKEDRDAAAREKAAADAERHATRVERALGVAGLDLDDEKTLARALKLVESEIGDDPDAIKAAVKALKQDMPTLFGGPGGGGNGAGDGGGGGRGSNGGNNQATGGVKKRQEAIRARKLAAAGGKTG